MVGKVWKIGEFVKGGNGQHKRQFRAFPDYTEPACTPFHVSANTAPKGDRPKPPEE